MKYIISIILIFNISVVNANEIFNLLKIPNLEIYNTNSLNGLKYLYAESNFKIGLKTISTFLGVIVIFCGLALLTTVAKKSTCFFE